MYFHAILRIVYICNRLTIMIAHYSWNVSKQANTIWILKLISEIIWSYKSNIRSIWNIVGVKQPKFTIILPVNQKKIEKIDITKSGSHLFCGPSDQTNDIFPLKKAHLVQWLIRQYSLPLKMDHLVRRTTEQVWPSILSASNARRSLKG